jgi:hypothetical protein
MLNWVYYCTIHEEGQGNTGVNIFVSIGDPWVGPCPRHEIAASRKNIFHAEWNIDWSKTVQLILELISVAFDNDETSCGSGLQSALRHIEQANEESCNKDLGTFWYYPELLIEPCSSTTRGSYMRSVASRRLFETRNISFQAIWRQKKCETQLRSISRWLSRHSHRITESRWNCQDGWDSLTRTGASWLQISCFINWANCQAPELNSPWYFIGIKVLKICYFFTLNYVLRIHEHGERVKYRTNSHIRLWFLFSTAASWITGDALFFVHNP